MKLSHCLQIPQINSMQLIITQICIILPKLDHYCGQAKTNKCFMRNKKEFKLFKTAESGSIILIVRKARNKSINFSNFKKKKHKNFSKSFVYSTLRG